VKFKILKLKKEIKNLVRIGRKIIKGEKEFKEKVQTLIRRKEEKEKIKKRVDLG